MQLKPLHKAILALLVTAPMIGFSQCKNFVKKQCLPQVSPYVYNGQLNNTILRSGESAEILMTFHAGQDYRVLVCGQEVLGGVELRLLDPVHNVLFSNKDNQSVKYWDFSSKSTQQIIIEVTIPASASADLVQSGCVAILVGFKQ